MRGQETQRICACYCSVSGFQLIFQLLLVLQLCLSVCSAIKTTVSYISYLCTTVVSSCEAVQVQMRRDPLQRLLGDKNMNMLFTS